MSTRLVKEPENVLELLEDKIMEWELDRNEAKIDQEISMKEIRRRVERIKATNCSPCSG